MDNYYVVVIACGHVGQRRSIEITRYFKAEGVINCYESAFLMPRSKKNNTCVKLVKKITLEEYEMGKLAEQENLYLNTYDYNTNFITIA